MPASANRSTTEGPDGAAGLGDPELRRFLLEYVKKRVPRGDVDDVVQTVLLDALASTKRPDEPGELRKWVVGIARHKCADLHRRAGRERPADDELPEQPAPPPAIEERALVRWAEEQAQSTREAGKTLDWMAREGEGDKLEHIAEEEALPPARVRQRVSRMRRFLKERWLAEVALVAALGAVALLVWSWLRRDDEPIVADPTKPPPSADTPEQERIAEGRRVRVGALEVCRGGDDQRCLEGLDRAKELDPLGDDAPEVREARQAATRRLREQEAPQQRNDDTKQKSAPAPDATDGDAEPSKSAPSVPQETKPAPPKPAPKSPPPKMPSSLDGKKGAKSDVIDLSDDGAPEAPPPQAPEAPPPQAPETAPPPAPPAPALPKDAPASKEPKSTKSTNATKGGKPMPPHQMQQQLMK